MQGVYTALITPFNPDGKVNLKKVSELIEKNLKAGVDGIVIGGTTAETPAITNNELNEILTVAKEALTGRGKLIIGAGTNATATTLEKIRAVAKFKPDALLVVTPYYNKPNASGLLSHFKAIDELDLPVVLYHIPGRTGLKVPVNLLGELFSTCRNITGIKEANYDIESVTELLVTYGDRISILAGNDDFFPHFQTLGGKGIISAAANLLAPQFVKIYEAYRKNQQEEALKVFKKTYPYVKAVYLETNPVCLKYLMNCLGYDVGTTRLPLDLPSPQNRKRLEELARELPSEMTI